MINVIREKTIMTYYDKDQQHMRLPIWCYYVKLSNQEIAVLQHTSDGKSSEEIATCLGISIYTVEEYWKRLRNKLRARNKYHALAIAWTLRIIH